MLALMLIKKLIFGVCDIRPTFKFQVDYEMLCEIYSRIRID